MTPTKKHRMANFIGAEAILLSASADWSRGGWWCFLAGFMALMAVGPIRATFAD